MDPKEYYYKQFRQDFEGFWDKVPNRPNYVTGEPLFPFAGLVKRDNLDALKNIKRDDLAYFLSALGCTILIDQVMYTHFREDYSEFQKMTLYPKMWVGWINENPWMVFHQNVRLPRNLHKGETVDRFLEFSEFFVSDLREFFVNHHFIIATWDSVKKAMLNDPDVTAGEFGELFKKVLKRKTD